MIGEEYISEFPPGLREELLRELCYNRAEYMARRRHEEAILSHLDAINKIASKADDVSLIVNYSCPLIKVTLSVEGFTVEAAPKLFEILEIIECDFGATLIDQSEYANDGTRNYYYKLGDILIAVVAILREDGVCKRVQVGTRKSTRLEVVEVDEPVYKIVC